MSKVPLPALLKHDVEAPSAFTAAGLMDSVRDLRGIQEFRSPRICILEFDGDLTDWLISHGFARKLTGWPCFHTSMYSVSCEGVEVGVIDRTIGGPYAVLVAEQLHAAGVELMSTSHRLGESRPNFRFHAWWSPRLPCATRHLIPLSSTRRHGRVPH